jgi:hypothetical protein
MQRLLKIVNQTFKNAIKFPQDDEKEWLTYLKEHLHGIFMMLNKWVFKEKLQITLNFTQ